MSVSTIVEAVKGILPKYRPIHHHQSDYVTPDLWQGSPRDFAKKIEDLTGTAHAVPMSSGSAALHIALLACGVKPGDYVLVPSMTFVATANAVVHAGAIPYFIDSSLFINPYKLRQFLGHQTRRHPEGGRVFDDGHRNEQRLTALITVNLLGLPSPIDEILEVANSFGLMVIEDAAGGLGSHYKGRHVGTSGVAGVLSFNLNKIVTTSGGGCLLTDDPWIAARSHQLSQTARLSHPWLIEHDEVAWNYRMGEVNAALGLAQLSRFDEILQRKQALTDKYREAFRPLGSVRFLEPKYSNDSLPNNWLNAIIVDQGIRDDLLTALHADGILARALPTPLHTLPMYKANPSYNGSMVEADLLWKTLVCLPSGPELV